MPGVPYSQLKYFVLMLMIKSNDLCGFCKTFDYIKKLYLIQHTHVHFSQREILCSVKYTEIFPLKSFYVYRNAFINVYWRIDTGHLLHCLLAGCRLWWEVYWTSVQLGKLDKQQKSKIIEYIMSLYVDWKPLILLPQKSHEILAQGDIRANLKHDEVRYFNIYRIQGRGIFYVY